MKVKLLFLTAIFAFNAALHAEVLILTVDIAKIYEGYYRAQDAKLKFSSSVEAAQEEIRLLMEEARQIADKLQEATGKAKNPGYTDEARARHGKEAEELAQKLRRKETEINNFQQTTKQNLDLRSQSILEGHFAQIKEAVKEIAEARRADLVLNVNGMGVVYAKSTADISNLVLERLNADAPPSL